MSDRNTRPMTMPAVADLIRIDGRLWPYWSSITCLALCWAESGGDAFARPVVINESSPAHLSLDVGLMQMNTHWQPHHKLPDLLTPQYNVTAGVSLALFDGSPPWSPNWGWWSAHKNGSWKQHLGPARHAINRVRAIHGEGPL